MKKKKNLCKRSLLLFLFAVCLLLPMTISAAPKKAPERVKLVRISAPAYNKINIQWKKVPDATHYRVYYKKVGEKKWKHVRTLSSKYSRYVHTSNKKCPIIVGQKYTYTVTAYNKKSNTVGKYDAKGLTTRTRPSTPKITSADYSVSKNIATITWEKADGADFYRIYRGFPEEHIKWKCIGTVNGSTLTFTDKKPDIPIAAVYTIKAYTQKTKVSSGYNRKGIGLTFVDFPE